MKILNQLTTLSLVTALAAFGLGFAGTSVQAQRRGTPRAYRVSDNQVQQIIRNIEQSSDTFRRSFDAALDRSRLNDTQTEDDVNNRVKDFEQATNDLRERFDGRRSVASDVENVLNRAARIDEFMRVNLPQRGVQRDWTQLKLGLNRLARAYGVTFSFDGRTLSPTVVASQGAYRVSDSQVETLLRRIETRTDTFRSNLDRALDRSRFDGRNSEDNINSFVEEFEQATGDLRRKFDGRTSVGGDVENVVVRAARIDDFMRRNLRRAAVQRDWSLIRTDLNQLANYYSLAFNLNNRGNMPTLPVTGALTNADARFTGTYRLNIRESDVARTVAERATRSLNFRQRERINTQIVGRLQSPDQLAIQRQGNRVIIASTRAPQVTLDVDNQEHIESYPNGRASRVRATLNGDRLMIVSNGDRTNDFTATFTTIDSGRRLLVTRSVYAERLAQPVEVRSYYDRTSDVAQFKVYNPNASTTITNNRTMNFIVPDGTTLVAALNTNLSTKTAREGDRFTMNVRSPSNYAGALIEGYLSDVDRSGRIAGRSGMTLNYETIRLPNNQTYRFAGTT